MEREELSGRELDAMVAEKVMGWTLEVASAASRDGDFWSDGEKYVCADDDFFPSTDIAAAFKVGEKVGGLWGIGYAPGRKEWTAYFQTGIHLPTHRGYAKTASEAICLAALAALRKPEGGVV